MLTQLFREQPQIIVDGKGGLDSLILGHTETDTD